MRLLGVCALIRRDTTRAQERKMDELKIDCEKGFRFDNGQLTPRQTTINSNTDCSGFLFILASRQSDRRTACSPVPRATATEGTARNHKIYSICTRLECWVQLDICVRSHSSRCEPSIFLESKWIESNGIFINEMKCAGCWVHFAELTQIDMNVSWNAHRIDMHFNWFYWPLHNSALKR